MSECPYLPKAHLSPLGGTGVTGNKVARPKQYFMTIQVFLLDGGIFIAKRFEKNKKCGEYLLHEDFTQGLIIWRIHGYTNDPYLLKCGYRRVSKGMRM